MVCFLILKFISVRIELSFSYRNSKITVGKSLFLSGTSSPDMSSIRLELPFLHLGTWLLSSCPCAIPSTWPPPPPPMAAQVPTMVSAGGKGRREEKDTLLFLKNSFQKLNTPLLLKIHWPDNNHIIIPNFQGDVELYLKVIIHGRRCSPKTEGLST